jgi:lysophospholipase L1-like esterase
MMKRVLVFGDSVEYGAWDTDGGWVDRVKRSSHAQTVATQGKNKIQIFNLGIGGDTSRNILARLKHEIDARNHPSWDLKLVFSFGTNDSRLNDGVATVPLEEFAANAKVIIEIAKNYTDDMLIVGNPPLGKAIVPFKDVVFDDANVKQYDEVLADVASRNSVLFVPLRPLFEGSTEMLFVYDNIHPNKTGHELICRQVEKHILNSL